MHTVVYTAILRVASLFPADDTAHQNANVSSGGGGPFVLNVGPSPHSPHRDHDSSADFLILVYYPLPFVYPSYATIRLHHRHARVAYAQLQQLPLHVHDALVALVLVVLV